MAIEALLPRHLVYVDATNSFWQITAREPLKYVTNTGNATEFSSLASGSTTADISISNLEPNESPPHLYQLAWGVQDGMQYKVKIPTGISRFGPDLDRTSTYITAFDSHRVDPSGDITEFWLVKNYFPAFVVTNSTPLAQTPQVWFFGMSYDIKPVTDASLLASLRKGLAGLGSSVPFKLIGIGVTRRTAGG